MALDEDEVLRIMSLKRSQIDDWYDVEDGTLVVTTEGAQTLIADDGTTSAVDPRRALPTRDNVKRAPIKTTATVGSKKA